MEGSVETTRHLNSKHGDSEQEEVMSEVHLGCPPGFSGPHISCFTFSFPPVEATKQMISFDEDGDLILPRRNKLSTQSYTVTIQHSITSTIPRVGLQVWKAELVLSDFLLHKMFTSSELDGIISLELGAGTESVLQNAKSFKSCIDKYLRHCRRLDHLDDSNLISLSWPGLVGVLLARVAKTVFITDHGNEILDNCTKNVELNSELINHRATVYVRELDWMNPWPPRITIEESSFCKSERYSWTLSEVEIAHEASLLVAADVIYSDGLTDAFFSTLERLMSLGSEKVLYLALEKRYNFSLDDLDVVANGYLHFQSYLQLEGDCEGLECGSMPRFVGKCIDITEIPQYMKEYERGNDVEIWQIKYSKGKF